MWQSVQIFNVFNALNLKKFFWKSKTFFKKLEYYFLVESTNIENAFIPYKTFMSETNVKTNRMVSTKWTYHKEPSFASNYFFWKFCFSSRTSYKELIQSTNDQNVHIHTFCKRWNFVWGCFFRVSILKQKISKALFIKELRPLLNTQETPVPLLLYND